MDAQNIPGVETCLRIMVEAAMPEHIAAHSIQVYRVASTLTDLFLLQGIGLNRNLVNAGALLHDITKIRSLATGDNHAATGRDYLDSLGYPAVARVVGRHVRLEEQDDRQPLQEEEIVNYADKRVVHTAVCSLADRRRYIIQRYGTDAVRRAFIEDMFRETVIREERLFRRIPHDPDELTAMVSPVSEAPEFTTFRDYAARYGGDNVPGTPSRHG